MNSFTTNYQIYLEMISLFLLILLNGYFSMTEIAVIRSKTSRLENMVRKGQTKAEIILNIVQNPSHFLAATQISSTLISIVTGAFSGVTFSKYLSPVFKQFALTSRFADTIALAIIVGIISYISVVIGELVPKKIGINNPEKIAVFSASFIHLLMTFLKPLINFLSLSAEFIYKILGIEQNNTNLLTEEELLITLDDSAKFGVIEQSETNIIKNILETNEISLSSIMIPHNMVVWLDSQDTLEKNLELIKAGNFDFYPLAAKDLDKFQGLVYTQDIANFLGKEQDLKLEQIAREALFLPENMSALHALLTFSEKNHKVAMVVDEFGGIAGIVEGQDIVRCLTGDYEKLSRSRGVAQLIQQSENSWLLDGMMHISEFKDFLGVSELPGEEKYKYNTLAGFILSLLDYIPTTGEKLEWMGYSMQITKMTGARIELVILTKL